ncbi:hypothetical protein [Nesterenkonia pannonica]|nr:hypothetical protein [Nesterenkonia pannonica]
MKCYLETVAEASSDAPEAVSTARTAAAERLEALRHAMTELLGA